MQIYQDLIQTILDQGDVKTDRTGVGTRSIFGYQMRFNLQEGFPILTTKRVAFGLVKSELLWFLRGDHNIRYLLKHNNHIWDEWAFKKYIESQDYQGPSMDDFGRRSLVDPAFNQVYQDQLRLFQDKILTDEAFATQYGDLGPIYGKQWRSWPDRDHGTIDQIQRVLESLSQTPDSRRHIVTAWNPADLIDQALPPCHCLFQFYVAGGRLSCQLYQRSADVFLGVPFNIASYALLTHLMARELDLEVGEFIHTLGDAHLYLNHQKAVDQLMNRRPGQLPRLVIKGPKGLDQVESSQIQLIDYQPQGPITAPIAV